MSLWDRISRQCRDQCQRHLRGYLACILRRTVETLRTLVSGLLLASQNYPFCNGSNQPAADSWLLVTRQSDVLDRVHLNFCGTSAHATLKNLRRKVL